MRFTVASGSPLVRNAQISYPAMKSWQSSAALACPACTHESAVLQNLKKSKKPQKSKLDISPLQSSRCPTTAERSNLTPAGNMLFELTVQVQAFPDRLEAASKLEKIMWVGGNITRTPCSEDISFVWGGGGGGGGGGI